jgi:hypothetical protein
VEKKIDRLGRKLDIMAAATAASRRSMGDRWGLAGSTALVTGGSKGIGYIYAYCTIDNTCWAGVIRY